MEGQNLSGFLILMNKPQVERCLSHLPLGEIRYFDTIGSTNDEALTWASQGAPDLSLIVADEQTSGRGRMDRKWFTPPHSGPQSANQMAQRRVTLRPQGSWNSG